MNDTLTEEIRHIEGGAGTLEGSLIMPSDGQARCLVLMLSDSGPIDRNHNSAQVQLNIFSEMANYLGEHGISTLRYDKRGVGRSKGDFNRTGHSDLLTDALRWVDTIQHDEALRSLPLFLLGHGEGTLLSPQVAAQTQGIAGQILLCPFLEAYDQVIHRQAQKSLDEIAVMPGFKGKLIRFFLKLGGDQIAKQKKLIQRIKRSRKDTIKIRKQVINAKWIREMVALDNEKVHTSANVPTLIIGGEKDLQSQPADAEQLSSLIKSDVETHIIPDLTHILRRDPKEPSVQHYLMLSIEPVDPEVLELCKEWMLKQCSE